MERYRCFDCKKFELRREQATKPCQLGHCEQFNDYRPGHLYIDGCGHFLLFKDSQNENDHSQFEKDEPDGIQKAD